MVLLFLLSFGLVYCFRRYALKQGLLDCPNERSSHQLPTPKGGGVVCVFLWSIIVVGLLFLHFSWVLVALLITSVAIGYLGFMDDKFHLSARVRIIVQVLASLGFVVVVFLFAPARFLPEMIILCLVSIFAQVWSTNLYNFMDGIDGIAAVEAIFIFALGGFFFLPHTIVYALSCWLFIPVLLGFLCWNWPKAKLFMGDVGSSFIGFIIVALALIGKVYFDISLLLWLMVYSLFIVDSGMTLIRRMLRRENWYQAHNKHAYQRLHQYGWSHQKIILGVIVINLVVSICICIAIIHHHWLWPLCIAVYAMMLILYGVIERLKPMD